MFFLALWHPDTQSAKMNNFSPPMMIIVNTNNGEKIDVIRTIKERWTTKIK